MICTMQYKVIHSVSSPQMSNEYVVLTWTFETPQCLQQLGLTQIDEKNITKLLTCYLGRSSAEDEFSISF